MSELFVEGVEDADGDRPRIKLTAFSPSDDQAPGGASSASGAPLHCREPGSMLHRAGHSMHAPACIILVNTCACAGDCFYRRSPPSGGGEHSS